MSICPNLHRFFSVYLSSLHTLSISSKQMVYLNKVFQFTCRMCEKSLKYVLKHHFSTFFHTKMTLSMEAPIYSILILTEFRGFWVNFLQKYYFMMQHFLKYTWFFSKLFIRYSYLNQIEQIQELSLRLLLEKKFCL